VLLTSIRAEILNGKGFILFKGLPVQKWGNHRSAVAYMGTYPRLDVALAVLWDAYLITRALI
jgi:hypothetical protein